ncbi:MAG: hypothetical protein ISR65_16250 [Bacteriovoracaceae bacterium]|nr:hypothetical protein [Bacteriovoracaceae bacterium]
MRIEFFIKKDEKMPILDVQIIGDCDFLKDGIAQKIANKAGEILGTSDGRTWVKLEYLSQENYAENGLSSNELRPVFIELLKRDNPTDEEKESIAENFAIEIGKLLNRPQENIHTYFLPEGFKSMAFGGKLIK